MSIFKCWALGFLFYWGVPSFGQNIVHPLGAFHLDSTTRWLEQAFDARITDSVTLIGLGEVVHGGREVTRFKAKMVQYLIEKKGVRTFLFEYPNAKLSMVDYYLGESQYKNEDTLKLMAGYALAGSLYDRSFLDLLCWIKRYNLAHASDRVALKGVDISGAAGSFNYFFMLNFGSLLDSGMRVDIEKGGDSVTHKLIRWFYGHTGFLQSKVKQYYGELLYNVQSAECNLAHDALQQHDFYGSAYYRDTVMARNIEAHRGTKAVFWAHNMHVTTADYAVNAGNILKADLGQRYYVIVTDFSGNARVLRAEKTGMKENSFTPDKRTLVYQLSRKEHTDQGIVFYDELGKRPALFGSVGTYGDYMMLGKGKGFDALVEFNEITPDSQNF
ncbi:erythromycin esterase family protein [Flavitalea sp. BT771]|uniref:erythromycin esterase family protein n=1 Tax=Flavitalea sp. BT771 TaxID=3063329 RepID=UPI0026E28BB0|nr:erythromycin esterase family protein [Flavitalea sp. BT771]MDO6432678.1 erythromycin esterase family protein [Flavitalea sp. BT771]MDV6222046.1 erythromycin esterase family protein [Flavitalea sp. BT771]